MGGLIVENISFVNEISISDYNMLRLSAGWPEIDESQALTGLQNARFLISAKYNKKTVGMARWITDGGYIAFIADVIVLPDYQNQGIGKSMMTMVMDNIKNSLKEGQSVYIGLMASKGKESFYKSFEFVDRPNDSLGAGMTLWFSK